MREGNTVLKKKESKKKINKTRVCLKRKKLKTKKKWTMKNIFKYIYITNKSKKIGKKFK